MADAARETHIRRGYLEALEAEDPAALPPAVYTRGFLKTYAEYLGLNPQAMVDLYQPQARREPAPSLRPAAPRLAIPRQIPLRPVLYGVGSVVFLALLGLGWNWYQDVQHSLNQGDSSLRRGTPTATGARLPTPFPIALASPSPTPIPPSPTPEPTPSPTPTPTPTPLIDGILVEFRTNARVYVEAAVDDKQVVAEVFAAGTQRSLPLAKDSVIMRANNGSAVEVTVNGTPQPPQTATAPVELTWRR